jgi:threonine dehydratase
MRNTPKGGWRGTSSDLEWQWLAALPCPCQTPHPTARIVLPDTQMAPSLTDIRTAAASIRGQVARTPLALSRTLSQLTGAEVWLKFENMQFTASFKERGALTCILSLSPAEAKNGVITMSAGNHAQAVAYHANRLDIAATIVMPRGTPLIKVIQTESHGAQVILEGDDLAGAADCAHRIEAERGLVFIHPYDDHKVIAGQGTVALEILEDCPTLDAIVVPVGGGGLASGVAIAAKAIKPAIEIIGVQASEYPFMLQALNGAAPKTATGGATIAEGIAVKHPGVLTLPLLRELLDAIIPVSEAQLERAVSLMIMIEKTVAEGAGAAGLAALLAEHERFRGRRVCLIVSGGNIDQRLLASVLMRDLAHSGRLRRICVAVRDLPGELARVATEVAKTGANIVDVSHHRMMSDLSVKETVLDLLIETRDDAQADSVTTRLREGGFTIRKANLDSAPPLS